ncbi:MAG TPA: MBL fold metallo-hydrolase RNA specificity domain-containing protein [Candidatus Nanoarchaeia archaeon]|nr:MBL fold metallo-hydrolase RNA specificity domain-containing protein [Candidatus Nanoarchaeia archaeon]
MDIIGVGGYGEVGRNMTFASFGNEAVCFDMGFNIQKLADFEESGGNRLTAGKSSMIKAQAIPDDSVLQSYKKNVRGILTSHCHLDHCAAIPYLAGGYNAPVIGTPFTIEVIRNILKDDKIEINNKLHSINNGTSLKLGKHIELEFINITHSTPSTSLIAAHSPEGIVLYANDFKLDNHPVLGQKPDYQRIKELGKSGKVKALVVDGLYSNTESKTPSEKVAREMLREVMLDEDTDGKAIVVTCFASHLARIKSVMDFANKLGRDVVLLGRSFMKYVTAAENVGVSHYTKTSDLFGYGEEIRRGLKRYHKKGLDRCVVVATGGQGEPHSVLGRMTSGELPFAFKRDDLVIFSNRVIPTEPNITHREHMEKKLIDRGLRLFKDVHASGHCYREDLRDFISMVNPEHIIPCQGEHRMFEGVVTLAEELGYNRKRVHVLRNGQKVKL